MKKAIITVLGKDKVGIIAGVSTFLAEQNINTLDITQSIVDGYFTMMEIVDVSTVEDYNNLVVELNKVGERLGVDIKCQKTEIFESMHRI